MEKIIVYRTMGTVFVTIEKWRDGEVTRDHLKAIRVYVHVYVYRYSVLLHRRLCAADRCSKEIQAVGLFGIAGCVSVIGRTPGGYSLNGYWHE